MLEQMQCTACGGLLNSDYVCPYCGARYQKPKDPTTNNNTTTVIINNYGGAQQGMPFPIPMPGQELTPAEEPEPVQEETPQNPPIEEVTEEEPAPEEKTSAITEFVNNSFGLMFIMLIAAVALCIIGVNSNNDVMLVIGLAIGAIFLFLSSKMTPKKKKDDNNEDNNEGDDNQ